MTAPPEAHLCLFLDQDAESGTHAPSVTDGLMYNDSAWPSLDYVSETLLYPNTSMTTDMALERAKSYLSGVVNPILCAFGIVGNILNIMVLTRRRVKVAMDCSMEKAAHLGLIALAISDMLYCVITLPRSFVGHQHTTFTRRGFWLYMHMYATPFQNIFMNTSTWLTVIMAAGRYAAICRPLQARYLVEVNVTRVSVILTFVLCGLLHLPSFWTFVINEISCPGGTYFIVDHGFFVRKQQLKMVFTILWFVVGYFVPVVIMAFCNVHLILALRESYQIRKLYRVHPKPSDVGSQITPTLIAIVCIFVVFVSPSEILHFCFYYIREPHAEAFVAALVAANALHTLNFAINFALYCIVNVHFRETWLGMIYCRAKKEYSRIERRHVANQSNGSSKSFLYNSMALETVV